MRSRKRQFPTGLFVVAVSLSCLVVVAYVNRLSDRGSSENSSQEMKLVVSRLVDTNGNEMQVLALRRALEIDDLKAALTQAATDFRYSDLCESGMNFMVVFDNEANFRESTTPFTAAYGNQPEAMRHIVGIYEYFEPNGHSELRFHPENIYEHKAFRLELRF